MNSIMKNQNLKSLNNLMNFGSFFKMNKILFSEIKKEKRCYAIIYSFIEDMHYKRIPFREEHDKLVEKYETNSKLIGGSFFPNDGGVIIIETDNEELPQQFVNQDPYYKNKLVTKYEIHDLDLFQKKKFEDISRNYKYR